MVTQRAIQRSLSLPVRLGFFSLTNKKDASLSINAESVGEVYHWWNDGLSQVIAYVPNVSPTP